MDLVICLKNSFLVFFLNRHCFCPESGEYLSVDLSGKNLRVMLVRVQGTVKIPPEIEKHNYMVPQDVMTGTGDHVCG